MKGITNKLIKQQRSVLNLLLLVVFSSFCTPILAESLTGDPRLDDLLQYTDQIIADSNAFIEQASNHHYDNYNNSLSIPSNTAGLLNVINNTNSYITHSEKLLNHCFKKNNQASCQEYDGFTEKLANTLEQQNWQLKITIDSLNFSDKITSSIRKQENTRRWQAAAHQAATWASQYEKYAQSAARNSHFTLAAKYALKARQQQNKADEIRSWLK